MRTMPHAVWAVYIGARGRVAVLTRPVDNNVDVLGSIADKISKDKGASYFLCFQIPYLLTSFPSSNTPHCSCVDFFLGGDCI